MAILEHWRDTPDYAFGERRVDPDWATFEEERRELLESVRESMASGQGDAECTAACLYLLRHLAHTGKGSLRVS